jgi:hypothetical protein
MVLAARYCNIYEGKKAIAGYHIPEEPDVKPMPNWKFFNVAEPTVRVSLT